MNELEKLRSALREAEAGLEVAIARILKADPSHATAVTSEAKALVIVRAALAGRDPNVAGVVGQAEWDKYVLEAWSTVRKHNHSIPDDVLDEMKARLLTVDKGEV